MVVVFLSHSHFRARLTHRRRSPGVMYTIYLETHFLNVYTTALSRARTHTHTRNVIQLAFSRRHGAHVCGYLMGERTYRSHTHTHTYEQSCHSRCSIQINHINTFTLTPSTQTTDLITSLLENNTVFVITVSMQLANLVRPSSQTRLNVRQCQTIFTRFSRSSQRVLSENLLMMCECEFVCVFIYNPAQYVDRMFSFPLSHSLPLVR